MKTWKYTSLASRRDENFKCLALFVYSGEIIFYEKFHFTIVPLEFFKRINGKNQGDPNQGDPNQGDP